MFRWHNNKWQIPRSQVREKELSETLIDLLGVQDDNNLRDLLEIVLRISEDPEKGGTIVFVQSQNSQNVFNQFKTKATVKEMGTPWSPEGSITSEDVIALVSQDGATLCPLPSETVGSHSWLRGWQYRKLLLSKYEPIQLLEEIETHWGEICQNQAEWPLKAKGSRRWNAAIAACNQYVNTVLVISQDGDIQIWHIDNNSRRKTYQYDGIRKIAVYEFPLQGIKRTIAGYERNARSHRE